MLRKNYNFWSNILFIIPLVLAVKASEWWYVYVLTASVVFSSLYHYYQGKKFLKSDVFFSYALIFANSYLLFSNSQVHSSIFLIGLVVGVIAILVFIKQNVWGYSKMHVIFHALSALICSLAIGGYL